MRAHVMSWIVSSIADKERATDCLLFVLIVDKKQRGNRLFASLSGLVRTFCLPWQGDCLENLKCSQCNCKSTCGQRQQSNNMKAKLSLMILGLMACTLAGIAQNNPADQSDQRWFGCSTSRRCQCSAGLNSKLRWHQSRCFTSVEPACRCRFCGVKRCCCARGGSFGNTSGSIRSGSCRQ